VCSGGILGSGLGRKLAEVRWTVAGRMALAWLFTLPVAAVIGGLAAKVSSSGNAGTVAVGVVAAVAIAAMWLYSRRSPVTSSNVNDVAEAPLLPPTIPTEPLAAAA
jgi:PiT family inorganic phosphate transporter